MPGEAKTTYVAVIGGGSITPGVAALAVEVGRELARRGAVVICGGLTGVMEAVARGVREEGGISLGILPGPDRARPTPISRTASPPTWGTPAISSSPTPRTRSLPLTAATAPSPRRPSP